MKKRNKVVQARLDTETSALLTDLTQALEWSESKIIRESLKLMASCTPKLRSKRITGVGKFSSGITDLGSDKRHLRGFGN